MYLGAVPSYKHSCMLHKGGLEEYRVITNACVDQYEHSLERMRILYLAWKFTALILLCYAVPLENN